MRQSHRVTSMSYVLPPCMPMIEDAGLTILTAVLTRVPGVEFPQREWLGRYLMDGNRLFRRKKERTFLDRRGAANFDALWRGVGASWRDSGPSGPSLEIHIHRERAIAIAIAIVIAVAVSHLLPDTRSPSTIERHSNASVMTTY